MTSSQSENLLRSALSLHQKGRIAEAAAGYARVRAALPGNFDAIHLGGVAALQQGEPAQAAALLSKAGRLRPDSALVALRLGVALGMLRQLPEAEASLRKSLALDAKAPEAWFHLGSVVRLAGRLGEAEAALRKSLELNPDYPDAHARLGSLLVDTRGHAAAEPHFRSLTELQPGNAPSWSNLGVCLLYLGRLGEALGCFARALQIDPNLDHAQAGKGLAFERCYRLSSAVEAYDRALAGNPRNHQARSARLVALQYLGNRSRDQIYGEHCAYGAAVGGQGRGKFGRSRDPDRPLRVGFLSPDLHRHSVAYFIEPILAHLDRAAFDVFLYHDQPVVDSMSERLRKLVPHWKVVAGTCDAALEAVLRGDELDILFDLAGHTGMNRLPLFSRGLAPIQATYLGYPDTTGLPAMDYRLVDAITDPPGTADAFSSERLIRFSTTAWSYAPPSDAPDTGRLGGDAGEGTVFGCFNNFAKVTDHALLAWGRLLAAVPGSRLLFKGSGLTQPALQTDIFRRLETAQVPVARVQFLEKTRTLAEHLAAYGRVDIALDTFPYHGTTTTCEALWMGVPVVSRAGDRHASRVGASLLAAVGHPEWLARSWDEYIEKAAALAGDPEGRLRLRGGLRAEMQASPLLDHEGQGRRFGAALRAMWREYCRPAVEAGAGKAA